MKSRNVLQSLCIITVLVCVALGCWQIWRYQTRSQALEQLQQRIRLDVSQIPWYECGSELHQRRVSMQGQWLPEGTVLVENKTFRHQVGYHVYVPFRTNAGQIFLVNSGWLPAGLYREQLPKLPQPPQAEQVVLRGLLVAEGLSSSRPAYSEQLDGQWVFQNMNISEYRTQIGIDVEDCLVWKTLPIALMQRDALSLMKIKPERHMGYAVQWFVLAMVIALIYFRYRGKMCS